LQPCGSNHFLFKAKVPLYKAAEKEKVTEAGKVGPEAERKR